MLKQNFFVTISLIFYYLFGSLLNSFGPMNIYNKCFTAGNFSKVDKFYQANLLVRKIGFKFNLINLDDYYFIL